MPRYELEEGTSSKFWEIEQDKKKLTICFGRIGSKGQKQLKTLGSEAAASKELDKLVASKTKKGYRPAGGKAAPATSAPPSTTSSNPELEQAILADPEGLDAWLEKNSWASPGGRRSAWSRSSA